MGLRPWLTQLLEQLQGQRPQLDLPLDAQATAFQRRVWQELRKIPYGSTPGSGPAADDPVDGPPGLPLG